MNSISLFYIDFGWNYNVLRTLIHHRNEITNFRLQFQNEVVLTYGDFTLNSKYFFIIPMVQGESFPVSRVCVAMKNTFKNIFFDAYQWWNAQRYQYPNSFNIVRDLFYSTVDFVNIHKFNVYGEKPCVELRCIHVA